jgi:hypothetical protein
LGLSVEASGSYAFFHASDKFNLSESSNFQSCALFLVVSMVVVNSSRHLLNEKLRQDPTVHIDSDVCANIPISLRRGIEWINIAARVNHCGESSGIAPERSPQRLFTFRSHRH